MSLSRYGATIEPPIERSFGSFGAKDGAFHFPSGISYHDGVVAVADTANQRVQVFDSTTYQFVSKLVLLGRRGCQSVERVCVSDKRLVVMVQSTRSMVHVFTRDGQFLFKFGSRGSGSGELDSAQGVVCTRDGRIVVADTLNRRVQVFSHRGRFVLSTSNNVSRRLLQQPVAVCLDPIDGRMMVLDRASNYVLVFSPDGELQRYFGGPGSHDGEFDGALGIACTRDGSTVVVADSGNCRLQAFTRNGEFLSSFGPAHAVDVAIDDEHRVLFIDSLRSCVSVIGAGQWLPKFMWSVARHAVAPRRLKQQVVTLTQIRSLEHGTAWSLLPNELLFEIFQYL